METMILVCLLIVIGLLLEDKIVPKVQKEKTGQKAENPISEIMGSSKKNKRHSVPNTASESHDAEKLDASANFDLQSENKTLYKQIPQEELDDVFGKSPDLWEEEKEWSGYGISDEEDGFATGVTFEELSAVGIAIQQKKPDESLEQQAAAIVQKIQGTELLSLLGNSMQNASERITELLSLKFATTTDSNSSILRDNKSTFNIEDFI